MLAEALAVITDHHDDRVARAVVSVEPGQEAPDLLVDVGDLTEVRPISIAAGIGLGWRVGRVGIVEMNPGEEARVRRPVEPGQGCVGNVAGGALDLTEGHAGRATQIEIVEVVVEALSRAPLRVENERTHEAAGAKTRRLELLGQDVARLVEIEAPVVPHAVTGRVVTGEDRRVSRQSQRSHRFGLLEQHALFGQAVEVMRLDAPKSVGCDAIRARRIERDQQQAQLVAVDSDRQPTEPDSGLRGDCGAGQEASREEQGRQGRDDSHGERHAKATRSRRCGSGRDSLLLGSRGLPSRAFARHRDSRLAPSRPNWTGASSWSAQGRSGSSVSPEKRRTSTLMRTFSPSRA